MRPFVAGLGVILTLHHVRPPRFDRFQPNRLLEIRPSFLDAVVRWLRRSRVDLVSLDEVYRRLTSGAAGRRFVCITIDDGYKDTLRWAYPILKKHQVPFAVYIPTSFPDRLGRPWGPAPARAGGPATRSPPPVDGKRPASALAPHRRERPPS